MRKKYICKNAISYIKGGPLAPEIAGIVLFQDVPGGTVVYVNITGLPDYQPAKGEKGPIGPHGFHIHEFGNCNVGLSEEPFKDAGEHWNPTNQPHGNHAGDFPVLFSNNGKSIMWFLLINSRSKILLENLSLFMRIRMTTDPNHLEMLVEDLHVE